MLTREHAAILVPRISIDSDHGPFNLVAANAAANWSALAWRTSTTTTSSSLVTALDYSGRGVLTKCVIAEVTSAAPAGLAGVELQITIDGNVVYSNASAIARQSQWRVVVGNQINVGGANYGITDEVPGLSFNRNCKIEFASNNTGTATISLGWKVAKKL